MKSCPFNSRYLNRLNDAIDRGDQTGARVHLKALIAEVELNCQAGCNCKQGKSLIDFEFSEKEQGHAKIETESI